MTYRHEETTKRTRTIAFLSAGATVVLTGAAAFTATASFLIPLAMVLPFVAMTVVEREIERDHAAL